MQTASMENLQEVQANSREILTIRGFQDSDFHWYRNAKDSRRGPWHVWDYHLIDESGLERRQACVYFVFNQASFLKYIGSAQNRLKDRFRFSPGYDDQGNYLGHFLFHSQCAKPMEEAIEKGEGPFRVLALSPEMADVTVLEKDLIARFDPPWNGKGSSSRAGQFARTGGESGSDSGPASGPINLQLDSGEDSPLKAAHSQPEASPTEGSAEATSAGLLEDSDAAAMEIQLTGSSVRNGRIYLSADQAQFFPPDSLGNRSGDPKGQPVSFLVEGEELVSDIRKNSGETLSPRSWFGRFLKYWGAKEGDRLRVIRQGERYFEVVYLGS